MDTSHKTLQEALASWPYEYLRVGESSFGSCFGILTVAKHDGIIHNWRYQTAGVEPSLIAHIHIQVPEHLVNCRIMEDTPEIGSGQKLLLEATQ